MKKFFGVIGNPPYQQEQEGDNKQFATPIYHHFIDESQKVSQVVELVHPARFLFRAGSTPKAWNEKMLADPHFKVLCYEGDSSAMFGPAVEIKGGVVVTTWNKDVDYGAIGTFTAYEELNGILAKAAPSSDADSLSSVVFIQNRFDLSVLLGEHPDLKPSIGSDGKDSRLEKNIFFKIPLFTKKRVNPDDIKVLGIFENKRTWRYIPIRYIDFNHENLERYKVMIPVASGKGELGEPLSTPEIGGPMVAYTRSFVGIGNFETEHEADNCLKYIRTKFARIMLGVLKATQMNNKPVWAKVPLQDFTDQSDIDWSKSIPEIDQQLYKKYGLDAEEIEFIETHGREMV